MLNRSQGEPSGMVSGRRGPSSVHGQPDLSGGDRGSSFRFGQRMADFIYSLGTGNVPFSLNFDVTKTLANHRM